MGWAETQAEVMIDLLCSGSNECSSCWCWPRPEKAVAPNFQSTAIPIPIRTLTSSIYEPNGCLGQLDEVTMGAMVWSTRAGAATPSFEKRVHWAS